MNISQRAGPPPRYKHAAVAWLGAFPALTVILGILSQVIEDWPLILKSFVVSGLMVAVSTWFVTPALNRLFRGWLTR